jgi:RNase P/RNase MRP subunit POP5
MLIRRKIRYILIEASRELDMRDSLTQGDFENRMALALGELHYADANPKIVRQCNPRTFIIRVNRGHEPKAILALSFIKEINRDPVGFYTIKTSGTIRSLLNACGELYPPSSKTQAKL